MTSVTVSRRSVPAVRAFAGHLLPPRPHHPFGAGLVEPAARKSQGPTASDRAWKLGFDLGRAGEPAACPFAAGPLRAAWLAGYGRGADERDAEDQAEWDRLADAHDTEYDPDFEASLPGYASLRGEY